MDGQSAPSRGRSTGKATTRKPSAASVRTGASKGRSVGGTQKERPVIVDRRFDTSRVVLQGLEAAIRAQSGLPAASGTGGDIPASLYFVAILTAFQAPGSANAEEVCAAPPPVLVLGLMPDPSTSSCTATHYRALWAPGRAGVESGSHWDYLVDKPLNYD
jgi:hypothetical protein